MKIKKLILPNTFIIEPYGTTTPWYSSLKIFRQEKVNDWEKPIKNLKNKLSEILQQ